MQGKRKDNKGRLLQKGESQRKDLTYQYRYMDLEGVRKSVYAKTLSELRKKEKEIQRRLDDGLRGAPGSMSVLELVETYLSLKGGIKRSTMNAYRNLLDIVRKEPFLAMKVSSVTMMDAKKWLKKIKEERGFKKGTVNQIQNIFRPAFQMAFDDMIINRNPFRFNLSEILIDDAEKKGALSPQQQKKLLEFVREDRKCKKYYDELVILLGTGLRVSEFCGLTKNDIKLASKYIDVNHQLLLERVTKDGESYKKYSVQPPKTESGNRIIPITEDVDHSLRALISRSEEVENPECIDGYSGFIVLKKNGKPKTREQIQHGIAYVVSRYNLVHPEDTLPHISPHILRHTFCTNMSHAGMKVKTLQYIMGHSSAAVTLNVYSHVNIDSMISEMSGIDRLRNSGEQSI